MKTRALLLGAAACIAASMPAHATTAYQQNDISTANRGGYQYAGQASADDFVSALSGTLSSVTWTGSYYSGEHSAGSESFTFNLYASKGANPGALLYSEVGMASFVDSVTGGASYKDYSLSLAGGRLTAGTEYWVSIYSNTSARNYAWSLSRDGSSKGAYLLAGQTMWTLNNANPTTNHVFSLNVTPVPEPEVSGMLLIGLGLTGFMARRRKPA